MNGSPDTRVPPQRPNPFRHASNDLHLDQEVTIITIGLDPHPGSHTVAALDAQGFVRSSLTVKNSDQGLGELLSFAGVLAS